jgi:putative transposase
MHELVQARPRFGYRRIHVLLLRHGWRVNMKRVRRLYRLDGLQLRHRVRPRKHASLHRGIPPAASRAHEHWSMDFVHDALINGSAFRALTVIDQWSRWSPIVEVAHSMSGGAVCGCTRSSDQQAWQTEDDLGRSWRHGVHFARA